MTFKECKLSKFRSIGRNKRLGFLEKVETEILYFMEFVTSCKNQ